MKFLVMAHFKPGNGPTEGTAEHDREMQQWDEFNARIDKSGVLVTSLALADRDEAVTYRRSGGQVQSSQGSFADTDEFQFAQYLIDVESAEEAQTWVEQMPVIEYGSVEVRPVLS